MDEERWKRIRTVVADALELPPGDRSEYARAICGDDSELLEAVQRYLALAEVPSDFLMRPAFSLHRSPPTVLEEDWTERQIGSFRLKRLLGRGGMGSVYAAEHVDRGYDDDVAVKILRFTATRQIELLEHERRALRSLVHPYIARFLESGLSREGVPFIVMQRVEGVPLDVYSKREGLSLVDRISLFQKLCEAIDFAHRKAVIHCDLKPSNILVSAEGQPHLLDFGIARFLDGSSVGAGGMGLSPLYATPEQFRGESPTTATDIYALGLLLYELLTGVLAHHTDDQEVDSIRKVVLEVIPKKPSLVELNLEAAATGADSSTPRNPGRRERRWQNRLAGDLDAIVLKALDKDPESRYPTVQDLSWDLQRFLEKRPVMARSPTFLYRTSKFVLRNAWAIGVALLLFGFGGQMIIQSVEIAQQNRQLAMQNLEIRSQRDRADEVLEFFVEFVRAPDPGRSGGDDPTVRETLIGTAQRVRSELENRPCIQAELLDAIGRVFTNLALLEEGELLLKEALEIRQEVLGHQHALVAESMHNLAYAKRRLEQVEEAEQLRRKAIAIQRVRFPNGHPDLALGLNGLASLLRERGALDEAEALAKEALDMQIRLLGSGHQHVAQTLNTIASVSRLEGRPAEAIALYRESLEIRRSDEGSQDAGVAAVLNNLALALVEMDQLREAIQAHREALAIRDELYGTDHPKLIPSLNNLALALSLHGEHDEALKTIESAIAVQDSQRGRRLGVQLRLNRASILERQGARDCVEVVSPILQQLEIDGRPSQIADARSIYAGCLVRQGRYAESEPILLASHRQLDEMLGGRARQARQARERVVALYESWGRPSEARRYR